MKYLLCVVIVVISGCCSLENEISRCGQKCRIQQSCYSQCPTRSYGIPQCYPLKDCGPQVVCAPKFCNNGAADYDNYRMVNCSHIS